MKKQYLIGLLGVAAISIPTGSSLLTNNHNISPQGPMQPSKTGLTLTEGSIINFNDVDDSNEVNKDDTLNSTSFAINSDNTKFGRNTKDGLTLYSSLNQDHNTSDDASLKFVLYDDIDEIVQNNDAVILNETTGDLEVELTEEVVAGNDALKDLTVGDNVNFYVTASYQEEVDPAFKVETKGTEEVIGDFETDSIPTDVVVATETEVTAGEVTMLTTTQGEISYDIVLGHDADGTDLNQTVTSVEWMDGRTTLASSKDGELSGTLTSAEDAFIEGDTYADTTIKVVMNDGADMNPITANVESFDAVVAPDKMGAGAVIGIIIAVLLGVGIIAWVGNMLYKKYNENKTEDNNEDKQEKEESKA